MIIFGGLNKKNKKRDKEDSKQKAQNIFMFSLILIFLPKLKERIYS
jgi:hypothetical protein